VAPGGVDLEALTGAHSAGGMSIAVVAEQLERRVREPSTRAALSDGQLAIAGPYAPGAGFTVRGAMGRNKIVYGLALAAVVVTAKEGQGGTWSGTVEALRGGMVPVFVRGPVDPRSHPLVALGAHELSWARPPARLSPSNFEPQLGLMPPRPRFLRKTRCSVRLNKLRNLALSAQGNLDPVTGWRTKETPPALRELARPRAPAMRYGLGPTSEEIGAHLGISAPGTRRRIQPALDRMGKELGHD
jgi:hypothetical protein